MKRYSDEWWQGVKDFNNSFPISIFKKDKEMTANELADKCNRLQGEIILGFLADCATMLRQQQAEIEALKKKLENLPTSLKDDIEYWSDK
jgi:hypothetical protein